MRREAKKIVAILLTHTRTYIIERWKTNYLYIPKIKKKKITPLLVKCCELGLAFQRHLTNICNIYTFISIQLILPQEIFRLYKSIATSDTISI